MHKTFKYPGILHACYRDSVLSSAAVAAMTAVHTLKGTGATLLTCTSA